MTTTALSNLRATPPEQVDTPAAAAAVANSSPWESSRATKGLRRRQRQRRQ